MKALMERGTPIRVAIPMPPEEPADLAGWARGMMPEKIRRAIAGELASLTAEAEILEVIPDLIRQPATCLSDVLGAIVHSPPGDVWTYGVDACVVTLMPFDARHPPGRVKWAANVIVGGRPLIDRRPADDK